MDESTVARRRILLGAGVAAAAAAAGLPATDATAAKPRKGLGDWLEDRRQRSAMAAVQASSPITGYVYRSASYFDFHTVESGSERSVGNVGMYENIAFAMCATMDIPIGAIVRDIEFYYSSTEPGQTVGLGAQVWSPGVASFGEQDLVFAEYGASSGIQVRRLVVPVALQGPFPAGAKLELFFAGRGSSSQQISGARVGFNGGGAVHMRSEPARIYDTRVQGGILTGGTTRAVTFSIAQAPRGTVAAIINLTALGSSTGGFLKAYTTGFPVPAISSINYAAGGSAIANGLFVGVSAGRQLTVYASTTSHFVVDLLGTVS